MRGVPNTGLLNQMSLDIDTKPSQAHLSAPGKDEFGSLQSMISKEHCYYPLPLSTVGKFTIMKISLSIILANRNSCAGGLGDELSLLIGHRHLGDAHPSAASHHPALSSELIIYLSTGDEMDVELGGYAWMS